MWWKDCGTVTNAKKRNRYLSKNRREFKHHEAIYLAIKKRQIQSFISIKNRDVLQVNERLYSARHTQKSPR